MRGLRGAVTLLTTVPMPRAPTAENDWRAPVPWYAPVGLALGGVLAALAAGGWWLLGAGPAAAFVVVAWVALTGALHLDGLADTADAAFAQVPRGRRLEILRDVHHGTFAVVVVALVLLLKFSVLASLPAREAAALVITAPVAGRAAVGPAMWLFGPARRDGMGASARVGAGPLGIVAAGLLLAGAALVTLGWEGLFAAGVGVAGAIALAAWLASRFGGLSGDCYGALVEATEVLYLIVGAAVLEQGHTGAFPLGWPQ